MALQVPFKIFLNTDSTAVIVTDNADVLLQTMARNTISVQPAGTDRIRVFLNDSNSYLYTDILDAAGATYGANRDLAAKELSNLSGFNLGGVVGGVTSVNGSTGSVTVDFDDVLAQNPDSNIRALLNGVGYATLNEIPIFLTETSTFADIQANRLHIYIGNAPLTIDLDTEIPLPPLPIPTQQNFSIANNSGFAFSIISSGGGSDFTIPARYSYANGITITDGGGGFWEANPATYVAYPNLQQVLSAGNISQNTSARFQNNPVTQETVFYDDGYISENFTTQISLWYNSRFIRKQAAGLKTWFINFPDLTPNANLSSYNVDFRPNVSGTVAYLTDVLTTILTGFIAGAGTVSNADTILAAIQKIVGNIALKLTANSAIISATKTKITYDVNGLVTAGTDATTSDITDSTNKRYQTDNQRTFNDATSSIQTQINNKLQKSLNLSDIAIPNTALNNILPTQTSQNGKILGTDGINTLWVTLPATFTGATQVANGIGGIVPAPIATEQFKILKGNGTWATKSDAKIEFLNQIAAIGTTTIFTCPQAGLYQIQVIGSVVSPPGNRNVTAQNLLHTEATVARVKAIGAGVNTGNLNNGSTLIQVLQCDVGTTIQYNNTMSGTSGSYNVRFLITKQD
jgi:hypothetical protein